MRIDTVSDFRRAVRMGPYAWPGGYDLYFVTSDGGCLCHACASKERRRVVDSIATKCGDGWKVEAVGCTADTDSEVRCDHCNVTLKEEWIDSEDDTTTEAR